MSDRSRAGQSGLKRPVERSETDVIRAAVRKSLVNMLTIGTEPGVRGGISPSGLVHSVGVSLLEMAIMARGAKKESDRATQGMPKFVDVHLSQEQKQEFRDREQPGAAWVVDRIQQLVFSGYRFGCSWSGEHQSYTVSMTCRNPESDNDGLCMTSFAGQLLTAFRLALYKHDDVCNGTWLAGGGESDADFG